MGEGWGKEGVQKSEHQEKGVYSQALRSHGVCLERFQTCLGLNVLLSFLPPVGIGMSILCRFGFTGSQLERNFASG